MGSWSSWKCHNKLQCLPNGWMIKCAPKLRWFVGAPCRFYLPLLTFSFLHYACCSGARKCYKQMAWGMSVNTACLQSWECENEGEREKPQSLALFLFDRLLYNDYQMRLLRGEATVFLRSWCSLWGSCIVLQCVLMVYSIPFHYRTWLQRTLEAKWF